MQKIHGRPNNPVIFQSFFGRRSNNRDQKRFPQMCLEGKHVKHQWEVTGTEGSNTNHSHEESSNMQIREGEHESEKLAVNHLIKPIEQRLSVLEEEDEVLKEAFLRSMEEKSILMNEIFKQFQAIHNFLRVSNQEREYSSFDEVLACIQALKKERRPGLLQVLWQDSNPSLIIRHVKARAVAVSCPAKYAQDFSSI